MLLGQGRNPKWRVIYLMKRADSILVEVESELMNKSTALDYCEIFSDAIAVEKVKGIWKRRIWKDPAEIISNIKRSLTI